MERGNKASRDQDERRSSQKEEATKTGSSGFEFQTVRISQNR
jgi:hypothetical protein